MKVECFLVAAAALCIACVTSSTSDDAPRRHRRLLRDLDDANSTTTTELGAPPKVFQSRTGRLGTSPSVQRFRSNVERIQAPAPPPLPHSGDSLRPPAPPPSGPQPPAPPIHVQDIKCMKLPTRERFSATISAPGVGPASTPVFEDRPTVDPLTSGVCQILPVDGASGTYQIEVTNLNACGVKSCPQDDQPWLCVTLRLPVVSGLKLPEDEIVDIRCKQQDRTVDQMKDIGLADLEVAPATESKLAVTFSGGRQEFLCEIGIFRRLPGTSLFSQRIRTGSDVQLGEEVQLRSIVRSNDGWFYSKLTEVVITRLKKATSVSGNGKASLVTSDGCRNPAYKTIAPQHPVRDPRSSLLNNFNFRVFLFQDMDDGDSIVISARVIACVEAIDCAPTSCSDDRGKGYGRRKRSSGSGKGKDGKDGKGGTREVLIENIIYPNGTLASAPSTGLKGWETDMALRVAMPQDLKYGGAHRAMHQSLEEHCFLYLILTVVLATVLGSTVILVSAYCLYRQHRRNSPAAAKKNTAAGPAVRVVPAVTESSLETLQMLEALSRSVREKKQQQRLPDHLKANVYSEEPIVRQAKRRPQNVNDIYWEITNQPSSILPPTRV